MEKLIKVIADMWVYEMGHENADPDDLEGFKDYLANKVFGLSEAEQEAILEEVYEELVVEYDFTVN